MGKIQYYGSIVQGVEPKKPTWIGINGDLIFEEAIKKSSGISRECGPAVIYADGTLVYKKNKLNHRVNGPAFISADGVKRYFVNGDELTQLEFFAQYGVV